MKRFLIIVFCLFAFGVVLFFQKSNALVISILLILVIDFFTAKFIAKSFLLLTKRTRNIIKVFYLAIISFSLAIIFRTFFIDIYIVPSNSMKNELNVGDYVIINKIKYGAKIPKNSNGIPLIGNFFKYKSVKIDFKNFHALPRWGKFNREDIVVFATLENKKQFFIKRLIGLPGDTLEINNSFIYINKALLKERDSYVFEYVDSDSTSTFLSNSFYKSNKHLKNNQSFKRRIKNKKKSLSNNYPGFWTRDFYGPVIIPKKGLSIKLTQNNYSIYRNVLETVEHKKISFNEKSSVEYTFENNYYFLMGDNRHSSNDSRFFGFVPEGIIQGKLIFKY